VLNSLTSAGLVAASLASLGAGGRLVEISKRDIWSVQRAAMERADAGLRLVALDFLPPVAAGAALQRLAAGLARGVVGAACGVVQSIAKARAAMRQMSKAQHCGKLVLEASDAACSRSPSGGTAVYGGMGALGAAVATWMCQRGASQLQLLGRSGRGGPGEAAAVRSGASACVTALRCDAATASGALAASVHGRACRGGGRLRGVLHAGGVLRDATLLNQSAGAGAAVFGAKVQSALAAARAWAGAGALDSEVLFSSVAALLGSAGQANYAAVNAALDAWAQALHARGCVSTSVQWGAWAGAGMASGDAGTLQRLERMGLGALSPVHGLGALQSVLSDGQRAGCGLAGRAAPVVVAAVAAAPAAAVASATVFASAIAFTAAAALASAVALASVIALELAAALASVIALELAAAKSSVTFLAAAISSAAFLATAISSAVFLAAANSSTAFLAAANSSAAF
jgi:hypothetical protein